MASPKGQLQGYTYADCMARDGVERMELMDGELTVLAVPGSRHRKICAELCRQIGNFLLGKPCEIFPAPFDVRPFDTVDDKPEDSRTVLQPDISVVCNVEKVSKHGCAGAPDFVVEILSPSTVSRDFVLKMDCYGRAGVREYWIVDPEMETVSSYLLQDGSLRFHRIWKRGEPAESDVLKGLQVDLELVFALPKNWRTD